MCIKSKKYIESHTRQVFFLKKTREEEIKEGGSMRGGGRNCKGEKTYQDFTDSYCSMDEELR